MLIWRMPSNVLVRSYSHVPILNEPAVNYDWDCCFNCGGTLLIEYGGAELGHNVIRCPICEGVGETLVAFPTINYYDWIVAPPPNVPIFLFPDEQINWHPQQ